MMGGRYNGGSTATAPALLIVSNKLRFYNSAGTGTYRTGATNINDGNWHQIYCIFEASATLDVYLDNVLDNGSLTGSIPASISTVAYALKVAVASNNATRYEGDIAVINIYDKALDASERLHNWDEYRGRYGL